jgi:pSer/pThr/pTyr-binding forkhead associated (FHA) protein
MAQITLRVLDGADRGRVFENLSTPVTIGREEGNVVQLNDERISRYHIKIQEDADRTILTDLASTNGTRVNGEDVQLRVLRFGDVVTVGRSVLLYGTREQIAARLRELRRDGRATVDDVEATELAEQMDAPSLEFEFNWGQNEDLQSTLHMPVPPELPAGLKPGQAAQVSEVLEFLHTRLRRLIKAVQTGKHDEELILPMPLWQSLVDIQAQLSKYLRQIGEPREEE